MLLHEPVLYLSVFYLNLSAVYLILKSSSLPLGHALIPSLSGSYCSSSIGFIWCTFERLFGISDPFEQNATVRIGKFGLLCTKKGFLVAALSRNLLLNYFPGCCSKTISREDCGSKLFASQTCICFFTPLPNVWLIFPVPSALSLNLEGGASTLLLSQPGLCIFIGCFNIFSSIVFDHHEWGCNI